MRIRQKMSGGTFSLSELLLDQVDEMDKELRHNNSSPRVLSPRATKFWQQVASLICTWSRNGRKVEVAGPLIKLRQTTRALMAEAAQLHLAHLADPLSMSDEQWQLLRDGLFQLKTASPPIWFRLEASFSVKNYK